MSLPPDSRFATFQEDGTCMVDAAILGPALGLSPAALMVELRAGLVYQVAERGIGADAGRMRLTFRYRHRELCVIVDRAGQIVGGLGPAGGTHSLEVTSCT